MTIRATRKISELDFSTGNTRDGCPSILNEDRLKGFTKRQLRHLIHRHAESAYMGSFWSFQVANSAAAKRVFGRFENGVLV